MVHSPFPGYNFSMDVAEDGTLLASGVKGGGLTPSAIRTPDGVWTEPAPATSEIAEAISGDRIVGEDREWDRTGALLRTIPVAGSLDVNPAGQVLVQQSPPGDGRLEPAVWRDGVQETCCPRSTAFR